MKKIFLVYILLVLIIPVSGQINKNGIPFIKNYSPLEYNAAEQNWSICEDHRGVIYIGNYDEGILEYDGKTWNKIPISNKSIVKSLAYSKDSIIYVGGVEEFGYLAPDVNGKMHYKSLSNQLDSIRFKDVFKTYTINNEVYFCTRWEVFKYKNLKLEKVYTTDAEYSFWSFKIGNEIYWGTNDKGLYKIDGDTTRLALGGEFYEGMDVLAMLKWSDDEILMGTIGQGIYIYNSKTGLSKSLISLGNEYKELYDILNISQVYSGINLSNGHIAIGTLDNGCIIFNKQGDVIYKLDTKNGIQDITVINLFETSNGNLWLSLNKGVSFVELSAPFTRFGIDYGIEGIVLSVLRYQDVLFVSTTSGVFYLSYDDNNLPVFKKIPLNANVFDMKSFISGNQEMLIFATNIGIFKFIGFKNEPIQISNEPWFAEILFQSKKNPHKLYLGYENGLALMEFIDGKWIDKGKVGEFRDKVETITEDKDGNLWLGTALTGIIKLTPEMKVVRYGVEEGITESGKNKAYYLNDEILCTTLKGVFIFNEATNKFEKYKGFGEKYYDSNEEVASIHCFKENEYWIVTKRDNLDYELIENLKISQDRIITINDIPFRRLYKSTYTDISSDGDNGVWFATTEAIYNYREEFKEDFSKYYGSLIRNVTIGIDSVVFGGTYYNDTNDLRVCQRQPKNLKITVPYKDRSFQFFYSAPYFPNEEIQYSYRLEGFEDKWSRWESKAEKGYTNLNEGKYTFMVKSKNIYGIESEIANYEFVIRPPWYRTILAYFIYFVLAIFIIYIIVKIYTRRLELEKIRLEQIVKERTAEVVLQKEEIEKQRDEIADKNQSITDSIEYASRIQKAILPSNEYASEILPEHFILFRPRDIVSGDFYWMTKKDNLLVTIAADCTGHGVPGAFMSMLGVSFLNEIVNRHEIISAGEILTLLRADVKKTLGQEGKEGEAKDGMDIALTIVDLEKMQMQYAGAYNPMYLYRNNELIEVKADRMPIGIYIKEKENFTNNVIDLQKGDVYYIFSDGFQDQFGGEDGQKFKTKNFKQLLLEIHQKPMAEQREILNNTIDNWRGKWEQVDDIIVLGVRI